MTVFIFIDDKTCKFTCFYIDVVPFVKSIPLLPQVPSGLAIAEIRVVAPIFFIIRKIPSHVRIRPSLPSQMLFALHRYRWRGVRKLPI